MTDLVKLSANCISSIPKDMPSRHNPEISKYFVRFLTLLNQAADTNVSKKIGIVPKTWNGLKDSEFYGRPGIVDRVLIDDRNIVGFKKSIESGAGQSGNPKGFFYIAVCAGH